MKIYWQVVVFLYSRRDTVFIKFENHYQTASITKVIHEAIALPMVSIYLHRLISADPQE